MTKKGARKARTFSTAKNNPFRVCPGKPLTCNELLGFRNPPPHPTNSLKCSLQSQFLLGKCRHDAMPHTQCHENSPICSPLLIAEVHSPNLGNGRNTVLRKASQLRHAPLMQKRKLCCPNTGTKHSALALVMMSLRQLVALTFGPRGATDQALNIFGSCSLMTNCW